MSGGFSVPQLFHSEDSTIPKPPRKWGGSELKHQIFEHSICMEELEAVVPVEDQLKRSFPLAILGNNRVFHQGVWYYSVKANGTVIFQLFR